MALTDEKRAFIDAAVNNGRTDYLIEEQWKKQQAAQEAERKARLATWGGKWDAFKTGVSEWFNEFSNALGDMKKAHQAYIDSGMFDMQEYNDKGELPETPITDYQMECLKSKIQADQKVAPYAGTLLGTALGVGGFVSGGLGAASAISGSMALGKAALTLNSLLKLGFVLQMPNMIFSGAGLSAKLLNAKDSSDVMDVAGDFTDTFLPSVPIIGDAYAVGRRLLGRDEEWNKMLETNPLGAYGLMAIDVGQLTMPLTDKLLKRHGKFNPAEAEAIKAQKKPNDDNPTSVPPKKPITKAEADSVEAIKEQMREQAVENQQRAIRSEMEAVGEQTAKDLKDGKVRIPEMPHAREAVMEAARAKMREKVNPSFPPEETSWALSNGQRPIKVLSPEADIGPVKSLDIINSAKALTEVNVGLMGKLSKNVLGYFHTGDKDVRIRSLKDFDTLTHEIGHFLDDVLHLKGADKELEDNATQIFGKGLYRPEELRGEGIAEFTREWTLNPEEAHKHFPQYANKFKVALNENPALKAKMMDFVNKVRKWKTQGGEARVGGAILFESPEHVRTKWDKVKEAITKGKTELVDEFEPMRAFTEDVEEKIGRKLAYSENPYRKMKALASTSSGLVETLVSESGRNPHILKAIELATGVKFKYNTLISDVWHALNKNDLDTRMADWYKRMGAKDTYEAFSIYMTSLNAIERAKEMGLRKEALLKTQIKDLGEKLVKWQKDYDIRNKPPDAKKDWKAYIKWAEMKRERFLSLKVRLEREDLIKKSQFIHLNEYDPDYKMPFDLNDAKKVIHDAPGEFREASRLYHEWNVNFLNIMKHYGLVDDNTAKLLGDKYKYYVPWQRIFKDDIVNQKTIMDDINSWLDNTHTDGEAAKGTYANLGKAIKSMTKYGSERIIDDPLFHAQEQINNIIRMGKRNEVAKTVVDLAKKTKGMSDWFVEVPDTKPASKRNRTFTVWEDGIQKLYQASDDSLYKILAVSEPKAALGTITTAARVYSSLFRVLTTENPSFAIMRNAPKDTFFAFINSRANKWAIPIWDTVEGIWRQHSKADQNAELRAIAKTFGLKYSQYVQHRKGIQGEIRKAMKPDSVIRDMTLVAPTKKRMIQSIGYYCSKMLDGYRTSLDDIEQAPRIQELNRLMKEGYSVAEAVEGARELTVDFSQGGRSAKQINMAVPFFNAAIQGTRTVADALSNPNRRKQVCMKLGLLGAASLGLWAINHDEQWYREMDDDLKNRYWVFGLGDRQIMTIPKPEGFGTFFSALERTMDYAIDNNVKAPANLANTAWNDFTPSMMPVILKGFWEYLWNYDSFRGRTILPKNLEGLSPKNQYNSYTSALGKEMGEIFGISPIWFDHFVKSYGSAVGDLVLKTSNLLSNESKPSANVSEMPMIGRIIQDPLKHNAPTQRFYEKLNDLEREAKDKAIEDTGVTRGFSKKPSSSLKKMREAKKRIDSVHKLINEVNNPKSKKAKSMTPDMKRDFINAKNRQITDIAIKALRREGETYFK